MIGTGDEMPWHIPADFRRFRQVTSGHTLIFGRKTHQGIGRVLPGRRIVVVTRDPDWAQEGVEVAHSVEEALSMAATTPERICYVGGGGEIYAAAWPYLTELDITHVHASPEGETTFPPVKRSEWTEISREPHQGYDFVQYRPTPGHQ